MPPTSSTGLRALLSAAGYEIRFRTSGWTECLVLRERERWPGRGESEDAALDDALSRMLPSHVARELLARQLQAAPPAAGPLAAEPAAAAPNAAEPLAAEPATAEPAVAEPAAAEPPAAEPPAAAPNADEPTATEPAAAAPNADEPAAAPNAAEPAVTASAPLAVPATAAHGPSSEEALAELDGILRAIEEQLGTFGRLAPARQRTFLLIWICRARSYEDVLPNDREVHRRIGIIARRLAELAKTFWPGSVRALQLTAKPWDVPELRVRGASAPRTWIEACARADRVLDDQLTEADKAGCDADGWMDDASTTAPVGDPAQVLAGVVSAIDGALGTPGSEQPETLGSAAIEALAVAAKRLRRLRRFVDGAAWGVAMGRLRRAAPALGARGARVRDAIDPTRRG